MMDVMGQLYLSGILDDHVDAKFEYQENERGCTMEYPMIDKRRTAKRIQLFMHCSGLRPTDIQDYLGLTCVQTVYRWLDGTNIPSIDNLYALSRLFGVKVDDMLAEDEKIVTLPQSFSKCMRLLIYYEKLKRTV